MQKVFHFYSDPGHGWLKVPRRLLERLNIENEISSSSYQRGSFVYLEEDNDLTIFMENYYLVNGNDELDKIKFIDHLQSNRESKIRSYPKYIAR